MSTLNKIENKTEDELRNEFRRCTAKELQTIIMIAHEVLFEEKWKDEG